MKVRVNGDLVRFNILLFPPQRHRTQCTEFRSKVLLHYDRKEVLGVQKLASQSIPSWNQIISWLKDLIGTDPQSGRQLSG